MQKILMQKIDETPLDVKQATYSSGYKVCKFIMINEIKDILEAYSSDGMMIVKALQDLIEKYGDKNVE